MKVGSAVVQVRNKKNLSQQQLAAKCGLTQSYLSLIESNRRKPSLPMLEKITKGLNIPLPVLMFLSMEKEDVPQSKHMYYDVMEASIKAMILAFFTHEDKELIL